MIVVVITRTPRPGAVKTRLIPALGAKGAARLHEAMAIEAVSRAARSGLPVLVHLDGALDHPFAHALRALGAEVAAQGTGSFGARLIAAMSGPGRRLALGTDCVTFDPAWLRQAAESEAPVALGPAEDGGYWCIAADEPFPALFDGIPWSTPEVAARTLDAAARAGLRVETLPICYDIDTPADLDRLRRDPSCPPSLRPFLGPP